MSSKTQDRKIPDRFSTFRHFVMHGLMPRTYVRMARYLNFNLGACLQKYLQIPSLLQSFDAQE